MKRGLPGGTLHVSPEERPGGGPDMLYAGLDLSRKRLDVHLLDESGSTREVTAVSPDGESAFIDADDSGSATPGDYTVFTDALYDHAHRQVGQDHARCTINYQAEICEGTFTLYGSDISVYGTLTATSEALAVTGGTGGFFGESGEADTTGGGETTTDFTITLT